MKSQNQTHIVARLERPIRLSDYAGSIFKTIPSRKGMKKAIDKGLVRLNEKTAKTGDFISENDVIELLEDPSQTRPTIELELEVLFEDQHLAIVYKPSGIEVSGNKKWTLENALSSNLESSTELDALKFAEPIHRLDYPTSGALLIGKTATSVTALNKLFENRKVKKVYHAVAIGKMDESGTIEIPIDGKPSKSTFTVLQTVVSERFEFLNLVQLEPQTGRRHQLRKHLSQIGNPILGDRDYGKEGLILSGKGLYLHASSLHFRHPITDVDLRTEAPLPKKFKKLFP
ncbi:MAG TPA: RNA pseudouridine synthase [Flavobacteriales bacterium]|nr:RNA pseudouridine synthase [Flavobacteriales bacterium]